MYRGSLALLLLMSFSVMAYEEPGFTIVLEAEGYELRFYDQRLVVQAISKNEDNTFMKLFRYISGANSQSQKIAMTIPVTQFSENSNSYMQFYLPENFNEDTAPIPEDTSLQIQTIESGYFAAIRYSGRPNERNFLRYSELLKNALIEGGVTIIGPPIMATYNGPFTLPMFRRNEALYQVEWQN